MALEGWSEGPEAPARTHAAATRIGLALTEQPRPTSTGPAYGEGCGRSWTGGRVRASSAWVAGSKG